MPHLSHVGRQVAELEDDVDDGAIDDVITTRRLVHIVSAYKMFGDKLKAITMCISRFDEETRNAVLDLYTKVDDGLDHIIFCRYYFHNHIFGLDFDHPLNRFVPL